MSKRGGGRRKKKAENKNMDGDKREKERQNKGRRKSKGRKRIGEEGGEGGGCKLQEARGGDQKWGTMRRRSKRFVDGDGLLL
jgi:hypothetical protein